MLHSPRVTAALTLAALAFLSPVANAISFPVLAIDNNTGDAGIVFNGTGTDLTIDAHALAIELDNIPIGVIDINPDAPFMVTAGSGGSIPGGNYLTGAGTLEVGVGGSLLSATFSSMTLLNDGMGGGVLQAALVYTGGSLQGGNTSGELIGGFLVDSGTGNGMGGYDFSQAFSAQDITGVKVGAVVPVPAAVWLFGSGLLGLVGIARRKAT